MSRTRFRVNPHSSERSFCLIQILGIIWQERKEREIYSFFSRLYSYWQNTKKKCDFKFDKVDARGLHIKNKLHHTKQYVIMTGLSQNMLRFRFRILRYGH